MEKNFQHLPLFYSWIYGEWFDLDNEDHSKVDVCGYIDLKRMYAKGLKPQDNGRTNTLLTISHMLAAVLHRRPIGVQQKFAYGLHRGMGMNPMTVFKAQSYRLIHCYQAAVD